jgi:hypothetical protein
VFVEHGDEPGQVRNKTAKPAKLYATFVAPDADPGVVPYRGRADLLRTCGRRDSPAPAAATELRGGMRVSAARRPH